MTESESVALPFGDSAISRLLDELYTMSFGFAIPFLNFFKIFCFLYAIGAKPGKAYAFPGTFISMYHTVTIVTPQTINHRNSAWAIFP